MKNKLKFYLFPASEIFLVFLVWLVSFVVSMPGFNRPLRYDAWLTGHTLVSMRAFEDWGFWKVLGVSILIPKSYEFYDVDITSFTKEQGVYLSYPSLWLVLPYVVFKLLKVLQFNVSISVQFLETYHLIVNRLICGVVIYYLYLEIIKILAKNNLTPYIKRLLAFLGLIGWMFAPPALYWTQNSYLSDQAVLLPIYIIFLISLKCKLRLENLSKTSKLLLFIASLFACSIDWYAWVAVAIVMLLVLVEKLIWQNQRAFHLVKIFVNYLNSIKFILSGLLISGFIFALQVVHYKYGFRMVLNIFLARSGGGIDETGAPLTLQGVLSRAAVHWLLYFPPSVRSILISTVILDALLIVLLLGLLYYVYSRSENKKLAIYSYILLFLVPTTQIALLKNHSYQHNFSAFKMGLPLVFSILVLPAIALIIFLKDALNFRKANTYTSIFILPLAIAIIAYGQTGIIEFIGTNYKSYQDLGFIVSKYIAPNELLVSGQSAGLINKELLLWEPPQALWYTNRFIYYPRQLQELKQIANLDRLKSMSPVFITYKETSSMTMASSVCQNQWIELAEKVGNREVVVCRSPQLRRLLNL